MVYASHRAMVASCPELYEGLEAPPTAMNELVVTDGFVKKVGLPSNGNFANELAVNAEIQPVSAYSDIIPTIYEVTSETITMEQIEGETLRIVYDPYGTVVSEHDQNLAVQLKTLTERLTAIMGANITFIHGDYSPNNILRTATGLVVIDFEKSTFSEGSNPYVNIAQLLTRLWYNRPLMWRLFELQQVDSDKEMLRDALRHHVSKKLLRGVLHYAKVNGDNPELLVQIEQDMQQNLATLIE